MQATKKRYQVKIYWFDWSYKMTINPSVVMNNISFSSQINWWQWQLDLQLSLPISNEDFDKSDFVQVTMFDEWSYSSGFLIYTWILTRIKRSISNKGEFISLNCLWLFAFMNRLFFNQSWYNFTKNKTPDWIIKDVIDYFNTQYTAPRLSYWSNIDPYWSNIQIKFDYKKCNEAIVDIQKATSDRYFYIDETGDVTYKEKTASTTTHKLKIWNEIDELIADEEVESVVNKVFVEYSTAIGWPYSDASSQTEYWLIEDKVSWTNIDSVWSANEYWANYIEENKSEKKQIRLTVNSKYDIESIKPWHRIKILNTEYTQDALQVQKISYKYDWLVVDLDRYETLSETFLS